MKVANNNVCNEKDIKMKKKIIIMAKAEDFGKFPNDAQEIIIAMAIATQCTEPELVDEFVAVTANYEMGFITAREWRNQIIDSATHFYAGLYASKASIEFQYDNN